METLTLRPYQQRVVDSIIDALNGGMMSPCASVATGGGKSAILSALAAKFIAKGHNVVALTHVRELIGQLERTALRLVPADKVGVIATGLGRKDPLRQFQICQIQTVGRRPHTIGPRRVCIIDEHHLLNHEEGQYLKTIEALRVMTPDMRLIGLSATPFRSATGLVYGPGRMFDDCVARVGMRELIAEGFLTPIVGKTGDRNFKISGVHMQGGDFKPSELQDFMADEAKVGRAVADFMPQVQDRRQVLIFSSGIKHNAMIVEAVKKYDQRAESIDGEMPTGQRDAILNRFRAGVTRLLVNASLLTTGYDDTGIDAICMLRPTRSPGLLLQCAGRGLRIREGKANCLFLDYGGCLQHFGPLDTIEENITAKVKGPPGQAPTKVCDCGTVLSAAALICPTCGKEFPRLLKHEEISSSAAVTSDTPITYEISRIYARRHQKKGSPMTLRLDYCDKIGLPVASEWLSISPEADAYAHAKSIKTLEKWPESPFRRVGDTLYKLGTTGQLDKLDTDGIVEHAARLKAPLRITTMRDGKYVRITKKDFT